MLSTLMVTPGLLLPANAQDTGTVCVVPVGSSNCSSAPYSFGPVSPGQNLTVAVVIDTSDGLNGFFVTLLADHTVLQPVAASISGTVLTSGAVQEECFQGIGTPAFPSCPSTDSSDTLSIAVLQSGSTSTPTSGLLFTATYKVLARTAGVSIGFQTGCSGTNTSPSNGCVEVENAGTANPETLVSSTFANNVDFTITAAPSTVETAIGVSASITINVASIGGFSDTIGFTTAPSSGLTDNGASLATCSIPPSCAVTLTVSSTTAGSYTDTVTATGLFTGVMHSVTVSVDVTPAGFSLSASPSSLTIAPGATGTSVITVTGTSGFSGMVALSSAPTESFSPGTVTLTPDNTGASSATSTITISVPSGATGGSMFNVNVTGTGGGDSAYTLIAVTVGGYSVALSPGFAVGLVGQPLTADIAVSGTSGFSGTVTLTLGAVLNVTDFAEPANCDPHCAANVAVSLSATSLNVPAGGTVHSVLTALSNPATTALAIYAVNVTFTSPGQTSQTQTFLMAYNDYSISIATPTITINKAFVYGGPRDNNITQSVGVSSLGPGPSSYAPFGLQFFNFVGASNTTGPVSIAAFGPLYPQVCILPEFYANGTQIPVSVMETRGPLTIAGPATGCADDSGSIPTPPDLLGLPAGTPTLFLTPTTFVLNNTALGTYTIRFNTFAGTLERSLNYQVAVVNPPVFTLLFWFHHISLSKKAPTGVTFLVGVWNNNPLPLNVQVVISMVDVETGTIMLTATSAIISLKANQIDWLIPITQTFPSSDIGLTFHFTAEILDGYSASALTASSTQHLFYVRISGTFKLYQFSV
jgi:hypothetical protein